MYEFSVGIGCECVNWVGGKIKSSAPFVFCSAQVRISLLITIFVELAYL